jgi:hypothetical protein
MGISSFAEITRAVSQGGPRPYAVQLTTRADFVCPRTCVRSGEMRATSEGGPKGGGGSKFQKKCREAGGGRLDSFPSILTRFGLELLVAAFFFKGWIEEPLAMSALLGVAGIIVPFGRGRLVLKMTVP